MLRKWGVGGIVVDAEERGREEGEGERERGREREKGWR